MIHRSQFTQYQLRHMNIQIIMATQQNKTEKKIKRKLNELFQTVLYDIICIPKRKNVNHLPKTEIKELILDALSNAMRNYIVFSGKDFEPNKIRKMEHYNGDYHWFNINYGYDWNGYNWIHLAFSFNFDKIDYSTNHPIRICFNLDYQSEIYPNNPDGNNQLCYPYYENGKKRWLKCSPYDNIFWIHYHKAIKRPGDFDYYKMFITKMLERLKPTNI